MTTSKAKVTFTKFESTSGHRCDASASSIMVGDRCVGEIVQVIDHKNIGVCSAVYQKIVRGYAVTLFDSDTFEQEVATLAAARKIARDFVAKMPA
jgi:hypothetical protein